jgi:hypothetical protein
LKFSAPFGGVSFRFRVSGTAYSFGNGRANPRAPNFGVLSEEMFFIPADDTSGFTNGVGCCKLDENFVVKQLI